MTSSPNDIILRYKVQLVFVQESMTSFSGTEAGDGILNLEVNGVTLRYRGQRCHSQGKERCVTSFFKLYIEDTDVILSYGGRRHSQVKEVSNGISRQQARGPAMSFT
jgi:hypothetical protein